MSSAELELRRARPGDITALVRIFRHTRAVCMPYLPDLHDEAEHRRWVERRVRGDGEVWVAAAPGAEPVGFAAVRDEWLDHLYVLPEAQSAGIGSRLLRLVMQDRSELTLWVFQKNVRAIAFYEAHGFALVERTDGRDNEEREPDARYTWSADAASDGGPDASAATNAGGRPTSSNPSITRT
jgi:putative acetyltransferase